MVPAIISLLDFPRRGPKQGLMGLVQIFGVDNWVLFFNFRLNFLTKKEGLPKGVVKRFGQGEIWPRYLEGLLKSFKGFRRCSRRLRSNFIFLGETPLKRGGSLGIQRGIFTGFFTHWAGFQRVPIGSNLEGVGGFKAYFVTFGRLEGHLEGYWRPI